MAKIAVLERKCTGCGLCAKNCPFGAIDMKAGKPELNAACKVCGICVKGCPEKAIIKLETKVDQVDKSQWQDILVFAEAHGGRLHPVSLELIGKAKELAGPVGFRVKAVLVGSNLSAFAEELRHYGVSEIAVYDDPALSFFRADAYAACVEDYIKYAHPSVVLVGATSLGRSLAPRLATRFHTGLTADCTKLELRENTDLVQIRPAFGGNIMAQIVTTNTRPQFATVRYKVFSAPQPVDDPTGECIRMNIDPAWEDKRIRVTDFEVKPAVSDISEADTIVAVGRGLKSKDDLEKVQAFADLIGARLACTRPLVEAGWLDATHQIGLSGKTVKPKLIFTFGISGAVQFAAGMKSSDCIIAVNTDKTAPIFDIAHYCIVGDLYEVIDGLTQKIKEA